MQFIDEKIDVHYDNEQIRTKTPECPDTILWRGNSYRVTALISQSQNFTRKGRYKRNMKSTHLNRADKKGSWGVGRFSFRVKVESGQIFDIYYDRAPENVSDRKGHWILLSVG